MGLTRKWRALRETSARAGAASGKSMVAQLGEIVGLRRGRGMLGMSEYYDYRVYMARDAAARRTFAGWRIGTRLQAAMTSPGWEAVANDKLLCCSLAEAWGLPTPRLQAIYAPGGMRHGHRIPTFATLDALRDFLAAPDAPLPLFVKPVHALTGIGAAGLAAYDARTDVVTLANGKQAALADVVRPQAHSKRYWPTGCIFQEMLRPHAEIARRCGPRLCTARVVVLLEAEGPRVMQVALRIATGDNMVDNFRHGTLGNSAGPVDLATGRVLRQVAGVGSDEREVTHHPDTGEPIVDFVLPDWEQALALCRQAAPCFGGFRYQGWDLAFTDRGPVLVELNAPFDMAGSQFTSGEGLWTPAVDRVLAELGTSP